MAEPNTLDVGRLLRALDAHRVEFVLVGGVAAGAHGATRATEDLDLVARRTTDNLGRLAAAMRDLGARLRVAGLDDSEAARLPVQLVGETLARMELSTWRTGAGDFDVLAGIPDRRGRVMPYEELIIRAEAQRLHGVNLRTAALDDIIASKEWANRPKDRDALPELRSLRDRRATGPGGGEK
ncbi:MAG: nucleotidyl transferase AbiEii/AbiGii toxin family protein [Ilumatobacteraceae bacterium]